MRTAIFLAALLAAVPAAADTPAQFQSTAEVVTTGSDALHRLTLPFEAYRDARPDMADLRMLNARAEPLPIAFAGDARETREALAPVSLPLFPVSAAVPGRTDGDLDVLVRSNPNGTIVSVKRRESREKSVKASAPGAWLIDASQLKRPIRALVISWDVGPGTEIVKVNVEASEDLRSWRTLASRAPLVRLEQSGMQLSQPRVELGYERVKYLRVSSDSAAFVLRSVDAEPEGLVKPPQRLTRTVAATPGTKPGEYLFDIGARLPVEGVRVLLPAPNSVAPFTVASRDAQTGPWNAAAAASFYRLVRDGVEIQSPAVEIPRRSARYWSLQLDPRSPGIGDAAPSLEVQWRPAQLVFVARGDPPYRLDFGNPEATRAILAVNELIPGYEPRAEWKLAEAKVGEVRSVAASESLSRRLLGGTNPRKLVLWAVLLLAVLALGWMAMRLQRQLRAEAKAQATAPSDRQNPG
jgi:hypothetical protein